MNFDDLDTQMRIYEKSIDQIVLPEIHMVARLDGNRFTRLTKEICQFEAPFDTRFRDMMTETTKALMNYGFRVVYGYTQSDEISLLFHPEEGAFGRKVRKYNSLLAGVASAAFSLQLGQQAVFDCRMIPLPTVGRIQDYFLWRQEDAHRNSLNAHCYWLLRRNGMNADQATKELDGKSVADKNELLYQNGLNFDSFPTWQKRGIGIYWEMTEKQGFNPVTNTAVVCQRRSLKTDYEIPLRAEYAAFISKLYSECSPASEK